MRTRWRSMGQPGGVAIMLAMSLTLTPAVAEYSTEDVVVHVGTADFLNKSCGMKISEASLSKQLKAIGFELSAFRAGGAFAALVAKQTRNTGIVSSKIKEYNCETILLMYNGGLNVNWLSGTGFDNQVEKPPAVPSGPITIVPVAPLE